MNNMLSATERAHPILEYVRELETKVRYYQAAQRRFSWWIFMVGFLIGMLMGAAVWMAGWYILHR